jgi:hypothetical protein
VLNRKVPKSLKKQPLNGGVRSKPNRRQPVEHLEAKLTKKPMTIEEIVRFADG